MVTAWSRGSRARMDAASGAPNKVASSFASAARTIPTMRCAAADVGVVNRITAAMRPSDRKRPRSASSTGTRATVRPGTSPSGTSSRSTRPCRSTRLLTRAWSAFRGARIPSRLPARAENPSIPAWRGRDHEGRLLAQDRQGEPVARHRHVGPDHREVGLAVPEGLGALADPVEGDDPQADDAFPLARASA